MQGGSHVEVFSAQGRDPLALWKLTGSVSRDYFKDVRGYVVTMEGGSSTTNTKMQLPKTDKASCMYQCIYNHVLMELYIDCKLIYLIPIAGAHLQCQAPTKTPKRAEPFLYRVKSED